LPFIQNKLECLSANKLIYHMSSYPTKGSVRLPLRLLLLPALLLAAGCHRDDVKVYRIAKDQDQASQPAAPALSTDSPNPKMPAGHPDISTLAGAPSSGSAPGQLTWKTPAGWTEAPPSDMRVASFKVAGANGKQADVSVIPLPGMAGTDSANVNRWRGQVGQPVMTDDELQKAAEKIEAGGQPAQLYDIAGKNPAGGGAERILGVIQHRDGMAWFYKMTGDADLVEQQKPAFVEFLKSLSFGAATPTPAEMPAANAAAGGDMGALLSAAAPVSHEGQPSWTVPSDWKEVAGGQFLVGKFLINDGAAAVNVSSSAGGLLANVNRWRGQLGLAPVTEVSAVPVQISAGKADRVDIDGTDAQTGKPAKLIGVVVTQADHTWFYKLMGDPAVVHSQQAAFLQFVQGVKY
jgi:hypothetical protein